VTAQTTTATLYEVKPAGGRLEGWILAAATLAVVGTLALYVRLQGRENEAPKLYDWQISAFDGLSGADQAIYNSLYTVKDEIPLIYDDINMFNPPGVKFRWPLWLVDWDSGDGYYCWRFPEQAIGFFHTYEEGFGGRLPIN
jgi:hypothetical protein